LEIGLVKNKFKGKKMNDYSFEVYFINTKDLSFDYLQDELYELYEEDGTLGIINGQWYILFI